MNDSRRTFSRRDAFALTGVALLVPIASRSTFAVMPEELSLDPKLDVRRRCWWVWRNGRRVRVCRYSLSE